MKFRRSLQLAATLSVALILTGGAASADDDGNNSNNCRNLPEPERAEGSPDYGYGHRN